MLLQCTFSWLQDGNPLIFDELFTSSNMNFFIHPLKFNPTSMSNVVGFAYIIVENFWTSSSPTINVPSRITAEMTPVCAACLKHDQYGRLVLTICGNVNIWQNPHVNHRDGIN